MTTVSLRRAAATLIAGAFAFAALPAASAVPAVPRKPEPPRSAAAITAELNEHVELPGTAWMTRPDGRILVSYDSTVTGARLQALTRQTQRFGSQVVLERMPGKLGKKLGGGGVIWGGEYKCSLGFNVQRKGRFYFLTAGHCGNFAPHWYHDERKTNRIGTVHHSSYAWNDYALVVYRSGLKPGGSVSLPNRRSQDITKAMNPGINQLVYRMGATSGLHSGRVTGLNATVNYPDGRVAGLIRTSVCADEGDSGGPLFYRNFAFGLTSGGTGDCRSGGVTYFQPVVEALNVYGVTVY
ncbi:S1 family peptidase [Kribbella sp. CA-293567]|uniref:S1 family peptidase n=1 Tax=Kribbella sp. CA-293567 TaxID=3002436 RepID=UPI0022DDEDE2|nr:S1 family peptidase [Kribbella sp. CA-293567]WBQ04537.1 S1 family peptidase [Kribbella sp. CA-293567]